MDAAAYAALLAALDPAAAVSQGAEATIYRVPAGDATVTVKRRFPKAYRDPALDRSLNRRRVRNEARMLRRLEALDVRAPRLLHTEGLDIVMETVEGTTLKAFIDAAWADGAYPPATAEALRRVGAAVARLHNAKITHGDLTSSNFLVDAAGGVAVIDFGLSAMSSTVEDMAVDFYVLERALLCTHHRADELV